MCLLNIFYLKCILTGMDVSGLSPGYPLTLEPPLMQPIHNSKNHKECMLKYILCDIKID